MSELDAFMLRVSGYWKIKSYRQKLLWPAALWRGHLVLKFLLCVMAVNALEARIFSLCYYNWRLQKDAVQVEEVKMYPMFIALQVRNALTSAIWEILTNFCFSSTSISLYVFHLINRLINLSIHVSIRHPTVIQSSPILANFVLMSHHKWNTKIFWGKENQKNIKNKV